MNRAFALRLANVLMTQCCIEGIRSKSGRFRDNFKSDDTLIDRIANLIEEVCAEEDAERNQAQPQTSGGRCKRCGGLTTYTRQNTIGLCMKCEAEKAVLS